MIPLHDDNPTTLKPVVTIAIIALCSLVFLWQQSLPPGEAERVVYGLGFVPALLFTDAELDPRLVIASPEISVITSMFLHGSWMHLIGNMLYLWIFGNNVEDSMGHGRFILFYLLCGVAAAMAQALPEPGSDIPMIGASGAIGGTLGAYLLLHPHARVLVLIPLGFIMRMVRVPALLVLGLWFVLQFLQGAASTGGQGGVAYWAHVGGFAAGAILILPFRRAGTPLLGRGRVFRSRRGPWS